MTIAKLVLPAFVMAIAGIAADKFEHDIPAGFSLANAKTIEIKDANGQVILRGNFAPEDSDKDDSELEAILVGTGSNTATFGKDFYYYKGGKLDFLGIDDEGITGGEGATGGGPRIGA